MCLHLYPFIPRTLDIRTLTEIQLHLDNLIQILEYRGSNLKVPPDFNASRPRPGCLQLGLFCSALKGEPDLVA